MLLRQGFLRSRAVRVQVIRQVLPWRKNGHWQNHIAVFSPDVEVAEYIVSDPPDEARYPTQIPVAHSTRFPKSLLIVLSTEDYTVRL
jgi:hypothetical protein